MKRVPLYRKKKIAAYAIVEDFDFEKIKSMKWYLWRGRHNNYQMAYAFATNPRTTIKLHRFILGLGRRFPYVDHVDCNPLNNLRSNLRLAQPSGSSMNRRKNITPCVSKLKGVSTVKGSSKFRAYIVINDRQFHLGMFQNELDAAMAYDIAAIGLFGEFARVNLPC